MSLILISGTECSEIIINGVSCNEVYMDGSKIFSTPTYLVTGPLFNGISSVIDKPRGCEGMCSTT